MPENNNKNILLVEDDVLIAMDEKARIEEFEYAVHVVHSAKEAIQYPFRKKNIELILMDIDLKDEINGVEAARRILINNNIPIVFLTSNASGELAEQAGNVAGYGYLLKKSNKYVLKSSIEMALKLFAAHQITRHNEEKLKQRERELNEKNRQMIFLRDFALKIASDSLEGELHEFLINQLKQISGASLVIFSEYDQQQRTLKTRKIKTDKSILNKMLALTSKEILETESPVSEEMYVEITEDIIGFRNTLTEVSFGEIPPSVDKLYRKISGVNRFIGIAYITDGRLYGTSLMGIHQDNPDPSIEMLKSFAHIAAAALQKGKIQKQLFKSEQKYKELITNINDVIFTINRHGNILYISDEIFRITGYSARELTGRNFSEFVYSEDLPELMQQFKLTMSGKLKPYDFRVIGKSGNIKWVRTSSKPVNLDNDQKGLNGLLADISTRKLNERKIKKLLAEKELLLKEVHHRIKNNMNIIATMLSYQARDFDDRQMRDALENIAFRVRSMIVLYDRLYRSKNVLHLSLKDYLHALINEIKSVYLNKGNIKITLDIEPAKIPVKQMTYLGIIINELINNSLKHGFKNSNTGKISITAKMEGDRLHICHRDNGIGYTENVDKNKGSNFGLKLINLLVKQFHGEINISNDKGTKVCFDLLIND
ncbi:MAG: PAS domain S-box protein [Fidelibacterota bacterium]